MNGRTLRSKRLRAVLWRAAGGKCEQCGVPLGQDWEADHIVPWRLTHRTNVHEMQALCRDCNGKKGAMGKRAFQRELETLCREIVAGASPVKTIILDCTTGGGKSTAPIILAKHLWRTKVDGICWITPRTSLQEQGERQFKEKWARRLFGHTCEIRQATDDRDPSRGLAGFVTTYQAVAANRTVLDEFSLPGRRYALILDEPHHVELGGSWEAHLAPIVERAEFLVLMSGTFERGNRAAIAFVPYRRSTDAARPNGVEPDFPPPDGPADRAVIRYFRRDALREKAIKPLYFHHIDGALEWIDAGGERRKLAAISGAGLAEAPTAIFVAMNTDYAERLLERAVRDWQRTHSVNPRSKLLVVAYGQLEAKRHLRRLRGLGIVRADVAVSGRDGQDESPAARAAIRRFKLPHGNESALDALVTVQMAYEGLDVPSITHIACLTHIRSRPWIYQMLGRASRVDDPEESGLRYESQYGTIWCPDDPLMNKIIEEIRAEQAPFVPDQIEGPPPPPVPPRPPVVPLVGAPTDHRTSRLDGLGTTDAVETVAIEQAAYAYGVVGNPTQIKRMMEYLTGRLAELDTERPAVVQDAMNEASDDDTTVPTERERSLREGIEGACRSWDRRNDQPFGSMNKRMWAHFRKSREDMREAELLEAWKWVNEQADMERPRAATG